jgi:hypothetical protein
MLARISKRVPMHLTRIDIDSSPELQARYFLEIPVLAIGTEEIARAPLSERTLEAALRARA